MNCKYGDPVTGSHIDHPIIALVYCYTNTHGEQWASVDCFPAGDIEESLHEMALENASSFGSDQICQNCNECGDNCDCEESDTVENPDVGATAYRWQFTRSYAHVNGSHGEDEVYKHLLELGIVQRFDNELHVYQKPLELACYFPTDNRALEYERFEQVIRSESELYGDAVIRYF
ncbi:hypothetical protein MT068_001366 [Salmonella enterica]|nr:hypothetical protein [Salmonella enterica]